MKEHAWNLHNYLWTSLFLKPCSWRKVCVWLCEVCYVYSKSKIKRNNENKCKFATLRCYLCSTRYTMCTWALWLPSSFYFLHNSFSNFILFSVRVNRFFAVSTQISSLNMSSYMHLTSICSDIRVLTQLCQFNQRWSSLIMRWDFF